MWEWIFFIPFPFPNFGNSFFHFLPIPEFWEWFFFIPFPFPNWGNGFFSIPFPFPNSQMSFPLTPALRLALNDQIIKISKCSDFHEVQLRSHWGSLNVVWMFNIFKISKCSNVQNVQPRSHWGWLIPFCVDPVMEILFLPRPPVDLPISCNNIFVVETPPRNTNGCWKITEFLIWKYSWW